MPDVSSVFPPAFAALAAAHFMALISPGPDFFLLCGHALRGGFKGSVFICVGIALGNAVYIAAAIAGWSAIKDHPAVFSAIAFVGAVYLAWMGCMLLGAKPGRLGKEVDGSRLAPLAQLGAGLGSALLNPKNALFYLSLMTVILGPDVSLAGQIACGLWMFGAVLLWDMALAAAIGHRAVQAFFAQKLYLVERTAGLALAAMAVWMGFAAWG